MSTLDLDSIKGRAEAVDRWCRSTLAQDGDGEFRPLSQREHFDRDMPLLLQIAEQRQADGATLREQRDTFARAIANVVVLGQDRLDKEAQAIVADLLRLDHVHDPIECACELTKADAPEPWALDVSCPGCGAPERVWCFDPMRGGHTIGHVHDERRERARDEERT